MNALAERSETGTACPNCGARLAADQDWCLECGRAVKIRIRAAPDWRVPLAIVAGVVVVVAAGLVFALLALSNSANHSVITAPAPAATSAPPAAKTSPAAPATHTTTASPTATTAPRTTKIASWPAGVTGYTVVLGVLPAKAAATTSATKLAAAGISAGVLDSSGYSSMHPGSWIVFSGTYTSEAQAAAAAAQLQTKGQTGAYAFSVVPAP